MDLEHFVKIAIIVLGLLCLLCGGKKKGKFNPQNINGILEWAKDKLLAKAGCFRKRGVPVGYSRESGREIWFDSDRKPNLISVGGAGTGKTTSSTIPAALSFEGSLVVPMDLDCELSHVCMEHRRKFGPVFILDYFNCMGKLPRGIEQGFYNGMDDLNPAEIYSFGPRAMSKAKGVIPQITDARQRYWYVTGTQLYGGVSMAVKVHEPPENQNYGHVAEIINGNVLAYARKIVATTKHERVRSALLRFANPSAEDIRSLPEVIENTRTETAYMPEPGFRRATSKSNFSFRQCRNQVMTVFVPVPAEMDYRAVGKFTATCAFAELLGEQRRGKVRVLVLLDEMYSTRPDDLDRIYATCRKKNVFVWGCLQGWDQLVEMYPQTHQSFLQNSGCIQILSASGAGAKFVADECGVYEVYPENYSESESYSYHPGNGTPFSGGWQRSTNTSRSVQQGVRQLILPQEVRYMAADSQILWLDKVQSPVMALRKPYYQTARKRLAGRNPFA